MEMQVPTGYFLDDHQTWGDLGAGAIMSRTYAADFPDLSASDDSAFDLLESNCRLMLVSLRPGERLQLYYYTSNDFNRPLDRYAAQTAKSKIEICSKVRGDIEARFRKLMNSERLIQANVRISLSAKLPSFVKDGGRKVRAFSDVFKIFARSFKQREQHFKVLMASQGGAIKALNNQEHYEELLKFWSPGQARLPIFKDLDWMRTVDDLCRFSGLAPRQDPDSGFYMDGYYFGILVAKTMPRLTIAKTMEPLMDLTMPNLRIVLNMEPLSIEKEILFEEDRYDKLQTNLDQASAITGSEEHLEHLKALMSNKVQPFRAQLIVIACERAPDKLDERMQALQAALGKTGCEPYNSALPSSTIAFYNCATPGIGPWVPYRDFWHKMSDAINVANMWAAGSTPAGDLEVADWIADGDKDNVIGGRCFQGAQSLHTLVGATTASGKSVLLQTQVLQTAPQFGFIVIIDDGMSWMTTAQKLDPTCRTIIVRANGNQSFNIFDTDKLPLSAEHLSEATALCHLIVGVSSDSDKDKLRHAVLARAISEVYASAYRKWRNACPEQHYDLCIETAQLLEYQAEQGSESFLDAFLEARATKWTPPPVDEAAAADLDRNPDTEHFVRNLAFAKWTPEMFPTLSQLHDQLHSSSLQKGPEQEMRAMLASLLTPWLRDGLHGALVDGPNNIDLGTVELRPGDPLKVVHFELEKVSAHDIELRAVAGFLILNQVRNHIQGMDRGIKKQLIIEEMLSFLKTPGGAQAAIDFYERMRKYSCQCISIFQQYSTLLEADPRVAKALIGNSSALLLLRNHNRLDLATLSNFLARPIPLVIQDQISRFPKPADLEPEDRYAGFVFITLDGDTPRYVVGRNYITEEVELITSSSGDAFEQKKKELRKNAKKQNRINGDDRRPAFAGQLHNAEASDGANGLSTIRGAGE
jgi:type IV secretion system protein TrbE